MDFLAGSGEMAERIRSFDWANHPFGPLEAWPQSLRSALSICLNSAFPTSIYWGPELRLLYNDAWAPIPGPRHPAALGARAQDIWGDIWHIIEPQFAKLVRSGEGLFVEDQMLPMRRFNTEEETYWNYSFTPIRAGDGSIVGIFNSGSETTDRVIQRRNAEHLLALNQDLRTCETSGGALKLAGAMLGQVLNASRVRICERTTLNGKPAFSLIYDWHDEDRDTSRLALDASDFTAQQSDDLLSGRVVRLSSLDPDLPDVSRRLLEGIGISSLLAVPWSENGQVVSIAVIQSRIDRTYSTLDLSVIEKVLETVMGWIERKRHRDRERVMAGEIDHRARNMLAVIQSIARMTKGKDLADFKSKLNERLAALARVHSLMGRKRWTHIEFRDLLEGELAPLGSEIFQRVTIHGPSVTLSAQEAQLFAMNLHELTTNALKHGSLSDDDGKLSVTWFIDPDHNMALEWVEKGQPSKTAWSPGSSQNGFGSVLLSQLVQNQLGGHVQKSITEDGVAYQFSLSLHRQASDPIHEPSFEVPKGGPATPL